MYSHDTYGLGHIRRTMAIAQHLVDKDVNILILTGSPIAGRYTLPHGIDFVRVPGMRKQSNTIYIPHSIRVEPSQALEIRKEIITATAKTFDPMMFIVDKVPTGLKGEIMPTLEWFRKERPETEVVLGLRDILDDSESTRQEWRDKNFVDILDKYYSEIWVYGEQSMYDPIHEYAIPPQLKEKIVFTGYIPRGVPLKKYFRKNGKKNNGDNNGRKKFVVVTAGGGGDGPPILETYFSMLEKYPDLPIRTKMISGPFVPKDTQDKLHARAKDLGVGFTKFVPRIEKSLAPADLVVSMGGYNTLCECLSMKKPTLIIPRETPRLEQRIRAEVFKKHGLTDFLPWSQLTPECLRDKITAMLDNPSPYVDAMDSFTMSGLDIMRERFRVFREKRSKRENSK